MFNGIQGLDYVISEAKKYNILLILSFVNNYNDFGGRGQYVQWARNAGVQINKDDDFYTHPVVKEYYKKHVQVRKQNLYQVKFLDFLKYSRA